MHKVIYDTDPGVDDAMALLFLHRHPEIDLIGITTVFGNASVETTTRNALFLKERFGLSAPVAKGAAAPLSGPAAEPPTIPANVAAPTAPFSKRSVQNDVLVELLGVKTPS